MVDPRWRQMPYGNPEPHWPPPHGAEDWWDCTDDSVGTADYRTCSSFWDVRIRLQVMVADGVIVAARCLTEDSEALSTEAEAAVSAAITAFLKDRTLSEAIAFDDDKVIWSPGIVAKTIQVALRNWATKGGKEQRLERLPPLPPDPEPYRYPLWQRLLRRIPFFRGFGL